MSTLSPVPHLIKAVTVIVAMSFTCATALPAFANGGGGGGGGGGGSSGTLNCKKGYTEKNGVCQKTSLLDDESLTEQGRALALNGYYDGALEALMAVRDKRDATVLTYIGYATRKLGKVEEGIAWYHKALAIDPANVHTREYLGEGYVATGRIDLARQQLAKLEVLCGKGCEQYEALSAAIAGEPESWGGSI